jgi:DNA polymerase-3 subunit delta'
VGKREVARAFAAELLAAGSDDPDNVRHRVEAGTHPDLTWVRPTGAHVMRRTDVAEAVVGAATRTPFEASRRVFVLERVDTLNDEAANSLLKTLEEPASFVHLILLTDSLGQVMDTVVSRCQLVRFDPLPAARIAETLERDGVPAARASACARLALGSGERARLLAGEEGEALLADVERMVLAALGIGEADAEPWRGLLTRAEAREAEAEEAVAAAAAKRLEGEPKGRERTALQRQFEEAAKRERRRARTEVLDLGLTQTALVFRDLICRAEGAPEAVLDPERAERLAAAGPARDTRRLRMAAERCEDVRLALAVNVSEDLALEALGYRLAHLVGAGAE